MTSDRFARLEALFDAMIQLQRAKVLNLARQVRPGLTADDILNSHDFPELEQDSQYNFEDGILAGYISAQMAVRAELRGLEADQPGSPSLS